MSTLEQLVERCGGLRPFAREVGRSAGAVQHWLAMGRVPGWHMPAVRAAAERLGNPLTDKEQITLVEGDKAS